MKVILLSALIGLSFYQASGNEDCPKPYTPDPKEYTCKSSKVSYGDTPNCLAQAMREYSEFLKDFAVFLCEYNACKRGENSENYKQAAKTFVYAGACLGCHFDKALGTGNTIQDVLTEISEFAGEVGKLVEKLAVSLNVAEPVADLLCSVTKLLQTSCAQNALANLAPSVVKDLTVHYCEEEDIEKKISAELAAILKDTGCITDKLAGTKDELAKQLESLGDTLSPVVGCVLITTKKVPVVGKLLCPVFNGLLGKGGLLNVLGGKEGLLKGAVGSIDGDDDGGLFGLFRGK